MKVDKPDVRNVIHYVTYAIDYWKLCEFLCLDFFCLN